MEIFVHIFVLFIELNFLYQSIIILRDKKYISLRRTGFFVGVEKILHEGNFVIPIGIATLITGLILSIVSIHNILIQNRNVFFYAFVILLLSFISV